MRIVLMVTTTETIGKKDKAVFVFRLLCIIIWE